jgi:outer membrane biosynthesis protein TonB
MPSRRTQLHALLATSVGLVSFLCVGCLSHQPMQASVPVTAPVQPDAERPMTIAPDTDASPPQPAAVAPPSLPPSSQQPPAASLPEAKMTPVPPKPTTGQPAPEHPVEAAAPAPAPQIVPQLSPAEQQNYQRNMNDDVKVAEGNLERARGRALNPTQQEMLEQVRSFLAQSRDASKDGDWVRAYGLSQKARKLSIALVDTL